MTEPIVECVPNFSEGRDLKKLEQILDAAREVDGVEILDVDPGRETNRTVVTLVGPPGPIADAAVRLIGRAAELIDMSKHSGAHARHGATDVCPFVPVAGVTMEDCIEIARSVGKRVGEELGIPVYLYDQAALVPERRSLAQVRAGEYEALPEKLKRPEWKPDFGPAAFNPRTGVVTIGAREFLIAYNINLNTVDKKLAEDLAFEIREKGRAVRTDQTSPYYHSGKLLKYSPSKNVWPSGLTGEVFGSFRKLEEHYREQGFDLREELSFFGRDPEQLEGVNVMKRGTFKECRAVGWVIPEYGRAQISINLTNFKVTPAHAVLEETRRLASERGLLVTGSEIVGMVPYQAMDESADFYLRRQGSSRGIPVADRIETAIQSMGLRDIGEFDPNKRVLGLPTTDGALAGMRINDFADEVSRATPAPGGGSVSALAGAMAASLAAMVANLTHAKPSHHADRDRLESIGLKGAGLKDDLLRAIDEDTDAFNQVLDAMRLPKGSEEERKSRDRAIEQGYKGATQVPLETAKLCLEVMRLCAAAAEIGLEASITDAGVGALVGRAGLFGAIYNVEINLGSIRDESWVSRIRSEIGSMFEEGEKLETSIREVLKGKLAR